MIIISIPTKRTKRQICSLQLRPLKSNSTSLYSSEVCKSCTEIQVSLGLYNVPKQQPQHTRGRVNFDVDTIESKEMVALCDSNDLQCECLKHAVNCVTHKNSFIISIVASVWTTTDSVKVLDMSPHMTCVIHRSISC